jgi:hypothetical protein
MLERMRKAGIKIIITGVLITLLNTFVAYMFTSFMEGTFYFSNWKHVGDNFAPMFCITGLFAIIGMAFACMMIIEDEI